MSNFRRLASASLMYASDNDGVLPGNDPSKVDESPGVGLASGFMSEQAPRNWSRGIAPYANGRAHWRCEAQVPSTDADWSPVAGKAECGYLANGIATNRSISEIAKPESLILFQEEQSYLRVAEERPNRIWDPVHGTATNTATRFDSSRWSNVHNGGGNLAFVDGETKYMKKESISFPMFGADPEAKCSDGSSARSLMMLPSASEQGTVDSRQGITCALSL